MFQRIIKNQLFLLFALATILLIVLFTIVMLSFTGTGQQTQTLRIASMTPPAQSILEPNTTQAFSIAFSSETDKTALSPVLSYTGIVSDQTPHSVNISVDLLNDNKTLQIKTVDQIVPYSKYTLEITDMRTKRLILSADFFTKPITPTKPINNDLTLQQYLPYEAITYRLSYNERLGIYIFNLKLNPNSSDNFNLQYENAKAEAERFIEGKGINLSEIVIDWRRT